VTVAEVFAGMRPKERPTTLKLLDSLEHYDITRPVAERAGLLRQEWSRRGLTLTIADLLIASVALEHGLILVTDNLKDFPMRDLRMLEP
jgi:predicted nucleic acid-binding protein